MKEHIKRLLYSLNYKIFMRKILLMESSPDFADNTYEVYKELIERGVNKKVKIVWFTINDHSDEAMPLNVKCVNVSKHRFLCMYYKVTAKYIIDSNLFIRKKNKHQLRIHLTHGEPIKLVNSYSASCGKIDYLVQTSEYFNDIMRKLMLNQVKNIVDYGYPRNDALLIEHEDAKKYIKKLKADKIIVWLPTYRNHKTPGISTKEFLTGINFPYGVPCIENETQIKKLNELLRKNNVKLVIKLHPAENTEKISHLSLSHIMILTDEELRKEGVSLYHLLAHADGMITDYSSVYYDFLLTDKPIGLAIPDLDEFSSCTGMAFKDYKKEIKGEYIQDYKELCNFIKNVSKNIDSAKDERRKALKKFHKYTDGKSTERVVNLFLKEAGLE